MIKSCVCVCNIQYIPRNMHTVFALLCFVVVIHWLIFPYRTGLLHWHCGNLTIAPVPGKQPWWIWINTSCEFIMNDCITTTKQSTTKPCASFLGYTVISWVSYKQWACAVNLFLSKQHSQVQMMNNSTGVSGFAYVFLWCVWRGGFTTFILYVDSVSRKQICGQQMARELNTLKRSLFVGIYYNNYFSNLR